MNNNLRNTKPWQYWMINAMLIATAVLLSYGLVMPLITFKQLMFFTNTFSIVSGVKALYMQDQYLLFFIVLSFSILIPILKIVLLMFNWNCPLSDRSHWRNRLLSFSAAVGRWSMLDVFAVAVFVVMMKIDLISEVETHRGLTVFTVAVLALMSLNAYVNHILATNNNKVIN